MAAKKPVQSKASAAKTSLYDKLIASNKELERKGATMPYTSVNGNMFSFLDKDGRINLRLSAEDREAFLKKYKGSESYQHGVLMKEYVSVPTALEKDFTLLKKCLKQSVAYAKTLKPKNTKKG
ncbi:MAG TPA: hypothetical protein VD905_18855 [Flavobacteriales bacterium]|nr:hypothetical protein [Flavobacteriales bacterium]